MGVPPLPTPTPLLLAVTYAQLLKLSLGSAEGLAYLHNQPEPIVHRDIKPQNILVTSDYDVSALLHINAFTLSYLNGASNEPLVASPAR